MKNKMHIKTGDTVILKSGRGANNKEKLIGKVKAVSPDEGKCIVEGVNVIKKHVKPRKQGESGGIIETEAAVYACKIQLYCSKCNKGSRVRVKKSNDGSKERLCVRCGEAL